MNASNENISLDGLIVGIVETYINEGFENIDLNLIVDMVKREYEDRATDTAPPSRKSILHIIEMLKLEQLLVQTPKGNFIAPNRDVIAKELNIEDLVNLPPEKK